MDVHMVEINGHSELVIHPQLSTHKCSVTHCSSCFLPHFKSKVIDVFTQILCWCVTGSFDELTARFMTATLLFIEVAAHKKDVKLKDRNTNLLKEVLQKRIRFWQRKLFALHTKKFYSEKSKWNARLQRGQGFRYHLGRE